MRSLRSWGTKTLATAVVLAFLAGAWTAAVPYLSPTANVGGLGVATDLGSRDQSDEPRPSTVGKLAKFEGNLQNGEDSAGPRTPGLSILDTPVLDTPVSAAPADLPLGEPEPVRVEAPGPGTSGPALVAGAETPRSEPIGTRGDQGLQVNLASVNAGGPYGPIDEGQSLTLTATQSGSPPLILIRWDFDGDGKFDHPASGWGTDWTVTHTYNDDFYGEKVKVEAYDGISTQTVFSTGVVYPDISYAYIFFSSGARNWGERFQATDSFVITGLRAHTIYPFYWVPVEMALWSDTGTLLRQCTLPATGNWFWNECPVAPYSIAAGSFFRVSTRITTGSYQGGYYPQPTTPRATLLGIYYADPAALTFPNLLFSTFYAALVDFRWQQSFQVPLTVTDTAFVDVRNVAPTIESFSGTPDPVAEGSPFTAEFSFSDPGLDDSWEYYVDWGDGTATDWTGISKWNRNGNADVLVLHSFGENSGDWTSADEDSWTAACGTVCSSMDFWDFGPQGSNTIPTLGEMLAYDVIVLGLNWFQFNTAMMITLGNRLADFMDLGGGVVTLFGVNINAAYAGIFGRFNSQNYAVFPYANSWTFTPTGIGQRLEPSSILLDAVGSLTASIYALHTGVRAGGTLVANYAGGSTSEFGMRTNPVVPNNARSIGLNFWPHYSGMDGFGLPTTGDWEQAFQNAICAAFTCESVKSMPITASATHVYLDDNPTGTNQDKYDVTVRVRDDDHGKLFGGSTSWREDFNVGTFSFPSTWTKSPTPGAWGNYFQYNFFPGAQPTQGPTIVYFDCDPFYSSNFGAFINCVAPNYQTLTGPTIDLSMVDPLADIVDIRVEIQEYWEIFSGAGIQNGWIEMSTDNFATSTVIASHDNTESFFTGVNQYPVPASFAGTTPQLRYRAEMYDEQWWVTNYIAVTAVWGSVIDGLDELVVDPVVVNVPPTAINGPLSSIEPEASAHTFSGYEIYDPAQDQITESFAYRWDFDDGTVTPWVYKGSLAIVARILILHTLCYPTLNSCPDLNEIRDAFTGMGPYVTVDDFNYVMPGSWSGPPLSQMLTYDLIIVSTYWAWSGAAAEYAGHTVIGNNLADYMDLTGNGIMTMGDVGYLDSFYGDLWSISGRYKSDKYGAFQDANFLYTGATNVPIGTRYVNPPFLDGVVDVYDNIFQSNNPLTVGGGNGAAGVDGVLVADWANGWRAIGMKTLNNLAVSVNMLQWLGPNFGYSHGADQPKLLRNVLEYVSASFPTPVISPVEHTWMDNGRYNVDLQMLDDDMGYDLTTILTTGFPTALVGETPTISHNFRPVEVMNVDPVITSIRASFAGDLCLRLTGNSGHALTLEVNDGTSTSSVTLTRDGGNPEVDCLTDVDIDVAAGSGSYIKLLYDPEDDNGASPSWLLEALHGVSASTQVLKVDFRPQDGPQERLIGFGDILLGLPITFRVQGSDVGSDNLGVILDYGDSTPMGVQVHRVDTPTALCGGANEILRNDFGTPSIFTGCDDPVFERVPNTLRSPGGSGVSIDDVQSHAFSERYLYYMLVLLVDDDNTESPMYPTTTLTGGYDADVILLDFR